MLFFKPRTFLIALTAIASLAAPLAHAGFFDSDDDKTPAPWKDEPLLQKSSCADTGFMEIKQFMDKYTPAEFNSTDIKKGSDQLMSSYVIAHLAINQANICLAEALGMDELKADLLAHRDTVKNGTSFSKKEDKKYRSFTQSATEKMAKELAQANAIKPQMYKSFAVGASTYLLGTYKTYIIKEDAEELQETVEKDMAKAKSKSSGGFSLGTLTEVFDKGSDYVTASDTLKVVLTGMPEHLPKLYSTSQLLVEYAKSKDIELEEDATESLGDVWNS